MLLALAALFAVINGANDGGAMVATTLRVPGQRAVVSIAALSAALVVVPAVVGTGVASTLTSGLVRASDDAQAELIATGVIAAVVVVAVLTRWGLPTSLTLGVVGGIGRLSDGVSDVAGPARAAKKANDARDAFHREMGVLLDGDEVTMATLRDGNCFDGWMSPVFGSQRPSTRWSRGRSSEVDRRSALLGVRRALEGVAPVSVAQESREVQRDEQRSPSLRLAHVDELVP